MRTEVTEMADEGRRQTRALWDSANEAVGLRNRLAEAIVQEKKAAYDRDENGEEA